MILTAEIQGIPCRVRVTHYLPAEPGRTDGPPELCYPAQPSEIEFEVLDTAGRPDPRLEATMDGADVAAIEAEIIAVMTAAEEQRSVERRVDCGAWGYA